MSNTSTQVPAPGQPISAPADFPVFWENPDDAKLTWRLESHVNANVPMAPLIYSVLAAAIRGMSSANPQIGLPFNTRTMRINSYYYTALAPTAAPPEVVTKAIGAVNRLAPGLVNLLMSRMAAGMTKQQLDTLISREIRHIA